MSKNFKIAIQTPSGLKNIDVSSGSSLFFVGANGGGKTRLAVKIENDLGTQAHRISAHRALKLKTEVNKISEKDAIKGLKFGFISPSAGLSHRFGNRWRNESSIAMLDDYDRLLQVLFAEQANKALETHNKARAGNLDIPSPAKFEKLKIIWERLIPHRKLKISGDDITVTGNEIISPYNAKDLSDGERAIFYLIGQTLCADDDSILIFDEPELHIHRAIMSNLWDELEGCRTDCAFIFITHDLEFAASRVGQKYLISEHDPNGVWTIEEIPESGFSEEITTKILGSRRPILFVEGTNNSLDYAIYRNCYPEWTIIPIGRCEDVIHSVVTMRNNAFLTRITCAGIVDSDDYSDDEKKYLDKLGIQVLPVSEIENLFVLPEIATAIAKYEGHEGAALDTKLRTFWNAIINNVKHANNIEDCVSRYCKRRIDRILKKIDLSDATSVPEIITKYLMETSSLNIEAIADERRKFINDCINASEIPWLMSIYDNKGILAEVALHLKATRISEFQNWILRILKNNSAPDITKAFTLVLPVVKAN
jgi:hypothetical protein